MRNTILAALLFLLATGAMGASLTVTIPQSAVPDATTRCEELRVSLRVLTASWSNDLCATIFTRMGLRNWVATQTRIDQTEVVDSAVGSALSQFDNDWVDPFTSSYCGDNTTDVEFGEECDDGNNIPGDGCDEQCLNE